MHSRQGRRDSPPPRDTGEHTDQSRLPSPHHLTPEQLYRGGGDHSLYSSYPPAAQALIQRSGAFGTPGYISPYGATKAFEPTTPTPQGEYGDSKYPSESEVDRPLTMGDPPQGSQVYGVPGPQRQMGPPLGYEVPGQRGQMVQDYRSSLGPPLGYGVPGQPPQGYEQMGQLEQQPYTPNWQQMGRPTYWGPESEYRPSMQPYGEQGQPMGPEQGLASGPSAYGLPRPVEPPIRYGQPYGSSPYGEQGQPMGPEQGLASGPSAYGLPRPVEPPIRYGQPYGSSPYGEQGQPMGPEQGLASGPSAYGLPRPVEPPIRYEQPRPRDPQLDQLVKKPLVPSRQSTRTIATRKRYQRERELKLERERARERRLGGGMGATLRGRQLQELQMRQQNRMYMDQERKRRLGGDMGLTRQNQYLSQNDTPARRERGQWLSQRYQEWNSLDAAAAREQAGWNLPDAVAARQQAGWELESAEDTALREWYDSLPRPMEPRVYGQPPGDLASETPEQQAALAEHRRIVRENQRTAALKRAERQRIERSALGEETDPEDA